jgi:hypothetical protein
MLLEKKCCSEIQESETLIRSSRPTERIVLPIIMIIIIIIWRVQNTAKRGVA